jgi:hypothetical protein
MIERGAVPVFSGPMQSLTEVIEELRIRRVYLKILFTLLLCYCLEIVLTG